jgi:hypothetical protein
VDQWSLGSAGHDPDTGLPAGRWICDQARAQAVRRRFAESCLFDLPVPVVSFIRFD